jgi:hypothetical protein
MNDLDSAREAFLDAFEAAIRKDEREKFIAFINASGQPRLEWHSETKTKAEILANAQSASTATKPKVEIASVPFRAKGSNMETIYNSPLEFIRENPRCSAEQIKQVFPKLNMPTFRKTHGKQLRTTGQRRGMRYYVRGKK